MNTNKVELFLLTNGKYFKSEYLEQIRSRLQQIPDEKWPLIYNIEFKDPTTCLIVSLVAGHIAVDRFLIGDVGLGLAKFFTCGGLGIWTIVDWFLIMGATKDKNLAKLQQFLY